MAAVSLTLVAAAQEPWEEPGLRDIRPSGPWNFAVPADAQAVVLHDAHSGLGGPDSAARLRIPVRPISWDYDKGPKGELLTPDLPVRPSPTGPVKYLELVPYGTTTLRLTVFPVLGE